MSCCANLADVQKACAEGRGVIAGAKGRFYIACVDKVAAIPSATAHVVSTDITMVDPLTDFFYEIHFDSSTNFAYDVTEEGEGQSKSYLTTINLRIPGIAPTVTNALDSTLNGEFVVIFEDKNGNKRIVGAVGDGALVFQGESLTDTNGYPVTITWSSAHKPYFYTGTIPVES